MILGLDGGRRSKSRNNAIMLSATEDETAALIKKAKTDAERLITYEPERRPEVANLLRILSLTTGTSAEALADGNWRRRRRKAQAARHRDAQRIPRTHSCSAR